MRVSKDAPTVAHPRPHNVQRGRYQGLQACWTITVMVHENGEVGTTLGRLDLASKWMRFTRLDSGTWEGSPELAAARGLVQASQEVHSRQSGQLPLW